MTAEPCVVFDMDGVLVDSEPLWIHARQDFVTAAGGFWVTEADTAMMGVSSDRWSVYMRDNLGLAHLEPTQIRDEVLLRMVDIYRSGVPLLPGARDAVEVLVAGRRLGLASGSDRVLLDAVLQGSGLTGAFAATVAGDEVAHGKPAPEIYLEVCERLDQDPGTCVAIEDSGAGIESALAAGLTVIAVPRPGFEPDTAVLARAGTVLPDLIGLNSELVAAVSRRLDK